MTVLALGRAADTRTDADLEREWRTEYNTLRQTISAFNVKSYELYAKLAELEMELQRRKWQATVTRAWVTAQPTRGPSWDTLGREALAAPAEPDGEQGRMRLNG